MDSRIAQIEQLIREGEQFTAQSFCYPDEDGMRKFGGQDTPEWLAWKTRVFNITKTVGADDSPAFQLAKTALSIETKGNYLAEFERACSSLKKALDLLLAAMKEDAFGELRQSISRSALPTISNKIFVVHGHDSALKTDVEQFLHKIGLEPVVLHRQPDQGQTIIEKFEKHSDVGYAIILLTADEVAYTVDQHLLPDERRNHLRCARDRTSFSSLATLWAS